MPTSIDARPGYFYLSCGTACADYQEDFFKAYVARESTAAVIAEPIQGGYATPMPDIITLAKRLAAASPVKKWKGLQKTITVFADGVPREIFLNPFL